LALAAVWVAVVASSLLGTAEGLPKVADDRLMDPGSAEAPSPVVLEEKRRRHEVAALDQRIKQVHDLGEAFESNPKHATTELREAAQSVQGELTQDRQRANHIAGEASAVEGLFRGIANTRGARDAAEIARDASIASEGQAHEDLGESADVSAATAKTATRRSPEAKTSAKQSKPPISKAKKSASDKDTTKKIVPQEKASNKQKAKAGAKKAAPLSKQKAASKTNSKAPASNKKAASEKVAPKASAHTKAAPKKSTSKKSVKKAHQGKVWSDTKGEYVPQIDMVKEEVEAKKEYSKLEQGTNRMDPGHIRRDAMRIAKTEAMSGAEAAALAAEKEDEGVINVAKQHDASMELESYEELQTHKLQEVRDKESDILPKLQHATATIGSMQKELRASLEEESVLRDHASTMAMKSVATSDVELGQGMGEDSMAKSKFASHVAKALADKVDREDWESNRLTAAERGRLMASLWKEGHTMLSKEAQLNREKKRYQLKKMAYAVRSKWDKDSLVDAFNVETQKWYKGKVLGRHGKRLNVHFKKLGINEWLPNTSKRLRVPKDAIQVDPEMGESASVGSNAAEVAGTMSEAQIGLLQKGVSREASDQQRVLKLARDLAKRSETLRRDIQNHLDHPSTHIAVTPTGASEYFIPQAVPKEPTGPTKSMADLGIDDVGEGASETRFINNEDRFSHPDLGEGADVEGDDEPDLGESTDLGIRLAPARQDDMLAAKNRMMQMSMSDLEKSALQQELLMRAKVAKLASQDSAFQRKVAKKVRKMTQKEKAALRKVRFASKLGVWNSVTASVAKGEASIKAKTKTIDANLEQEDRFRAQVIQRATELAKEASRIDQLEKSAVGVASRLGEAVNAAE